MNIARTKINPCMASLDSLIDAVMKDEELPILHLTSKKVELQEVIDYCTRIIEEMKLHKEYYTDLTIKKLHPVLQRSIHSSTRMLLSLDRSSPPKKINPVTVAKEVRCQKEDVDLGIKSIGIIQLIGTRKAIVYDTKHRSIRVFITSDMINGFTFSGTTMKNINLDESYSKTVRKPDMFFKGFTELTFDKKIRRIEELSTQQSSLNGRFNQNHIPLGVSNAR